MTLEEALEQTMIFTAARGAGANRLEKLDRSVPFSFDRPTPSQKAPTAEQILMNRIWHWEYGHSEPREIRNIQIAARGMGSIPYSMQNRVFDRVSFEDVEVTLQAGQDPITLPITADYVLETYFLREGKIFDAKKGLWQLEANVDASILTVLGYILTPKNGIGPIDPKARGSVLEGPASSNNLKDLRVSLGRAVDTEKTTNTVQASSSCFIVCVSLTCCKERPDWEPGEFLGAARIYPHVMVWASQIVHKISAPVLIDRPANTMMHESPKNSKMMSAIGAVYFTDTNEDRGVTAKLHKPLPLWNNFFDYYDLEPHANYKNRAPLKGADPEDMRPGECCFVDVRRGTERTVEKIVQRAQTSILTMSDNFEPGVPLFKDKVEELFRSDFYGELEDIKKVGYQGEFDNVHLAPRMSTTFEFDGDVVTKDNIIMAPFCVHDCLHMHVRWGKIHAGEMPKSNRGFSGGLPYQKTGACMVPENQSVFIKLTSPHAYRYRGVAHGPIEPNQWQVFFHHGASHSCDIWPGASFIEVGFARSGVDTYAKSCDEPYTDGGMDYGLFSWAVFYWRLRYGGWQMSGPFGINDRNIIMERIHVPDLKRARRG